jgi:hypothetical protein
MRCRLPLSVARGQLRRGRAMDALPVAAAALCEGAISPAHLDALARATTPATEGSMARDEALLVDTANELSFSSFTRSLAYWGQLADPDGSESAHAARLARRDVYLTESLDGMFFGQMTLDPVGGTIVSNEHSRLEQSLFESDWAEAKARLGRDPKVHELARTGAQRRADALVEMATRSASLPEGSRRPSPLFSVLVGYETLHGRICELAGGTVLTPGALVPWLDEALIERAVFSPGKRVEVGATTRLFSGATRRAIELRDRICAHPYCEVPGEQCQVDHIIPAAHGGPTTQENGRLLCGFHNRARNGRPPPGD